MEEEADRDGDIEGRMISGKNRHGVFAFNLRRELNERLNRGVAKKRGNRENVGCQGNLIIIPCRSLAISNFVPIKQDRLSTICLRFYLSPRSS